MVLELYIFEKGFNATHLCVFPGEIIEYGV